MSLEIQKAPLLIYFTELGMVSSSNFVQPAKASSEMLPNPSLKVALDNCLQFSKAFHPMDVTEDGIVTLSIAELRNAESPIPFTKNDLPL